MRSGRFQKKLVSVKQRLVVHDVASAVDWSGLDSALEGASSVDRSGLDSALESAGTVDWSGLDLALEGAGAVDRSGLDLAVEAEVGGGEGNHFCCW